MKNRLVSFKLLFESILCPATESFGLTNKNKKILKEFANKCLSHIKASKNFKEYKTWGFRSSENNVYNFRTEGNKCYYYIANFASYPEDVGIDIKNINDEKKFDKQVESIVKKACDEIQKKLPSNIKIENIRYNPTVIQIRLVMNKSQ